MFIIKIFIAAHFCNYTVYQNLIYYS